MARLSTDGNLADLTFPQSEQHGNSIQLSASTLKQHGKNGRGQNSHIFAFPFAHCRIHSHAWNCCASPFFENFPSTIYFCHNGLCQPLLRATIPYISLQVRSGWRLCCIETWAHTCPQRMPASDWAVKQSIRITRSSSTHRSSQLPSTRRAIRFTCLSRWSSLSNTYRYVRHM